MRGANSVPRPTPGAVTRSNGNIDHDPDLDHDRVRQPVPSQLRRKGALQRRNEKKKMWLVTSSLLG